MTTHICIFGEVLFDTFPNGQQVLGGAPFNVAWHLQAFGLAPRFVSRIGNDEMGNRIIEGMLNHGMDTSAMQRDDTLITGQVTVDLYNGEPSYDIVSPCAYDAIDAQACKSYDCDLLYHGSLALRHPQSARALDCLIETANPRIYLDVNLRPPWWDKNHLLGMIKRAHWTKLNNHEFNQFTSGKGSMIERMSQFIEENQLQAVILTHGEKGAEVLLASGKHFEVEPELSSDVVDTVGAGDAFSAVTLAGIVNDWPMDLTLERAQAFASALVSVRGATVSDASFYQQIMSSWKQY